MKIQSSVLVFTVFTICAVALSGCVSGTPDKGTSAGVISGEVPISSPHVAGRKIEAGEPGTGTERFALPFLFERAPKDAGRGADFVLQRPGHALSVNRTGFEAFLAPAATKAGERVPGSGPGRLAVRFVGARKAARLVAVGEPRLFVNRFLGRSPANWERDVPAYEAVRYQGLYPDIDLTLRTVTGQIEYVFDLGPTGSVDNIRFRIAGAKRLSLAEDGALLVEVSNGRVIRHRAPLAVEHSAKGERMLAAAFRLVGQETVAFQVDGRRKGRRVTIDPVINFGSYFGGIDSETAGLGSVNLPIPALDLAVADDGGILVTGSTYSVASSSMAFVLRADLDAPGGPVFDYLTYLGDTQDDRAFGITKGPRDSVYICGRTTSTGFPQAGKTFDQTYSTLAAGFVALLEANGNLARTTFLEAGKLTEITDCLYSDSASAGGAQPESPASGLYLTGHTLPETDSDLDARLVFSDSFQTRYRGHTDAVLAKFTEDLGDLEYFTLLGGRHSDKAFGLGVIDGAMIITGMTESPDLPVTPGAYAGPTLSLADAKICAAPTHPANCLETFVARLNTDGTDFDYITYLGDAEGDYGKGIAVDADGFAFVTGTRWIGGSARQAFLARLMPDGSALAYNNRFSGLASWGYGIALDSSGVAHVVGATEEWGIAVGPALDPDHNGEADGYYATFDPAGNLDYRTYLGGEADDKAYAVVRDHDNCTVIGLETWSDILDLPLPGAPQNARAGASDVLLLRHCESVPFEGVALLKEMPGLIAPGGSGILQLTVKNASSYKSGPFRVEDTIPFPFDLTGVSNSACHTAGQKVICDFQGIQSGGEVIVVHIDNLLFCETAGEQMFRTNTARLTGPGGYEKTATFDMPYRACSTPPPPICAGVERCYCSSDEDCDEGRVCKGEKVPFYRRGRIIYYLYGPEICVPE